VIVGEVKERQEAKVIYETAKASGQAAALLEQERPNLFTNSVANIGPHETVIVQIEYQETVKQSSGTFSLRLPLVVAPRYMPAPIVQSVDFSSDGYGVAVNDPVPDGTDQSAGSRSQEIPVNPNDLGYLNAGFALGEVKSLYHPIKLTL
jgi:Ca-activated chloride channel family protein